MNTTQLLKESLRETNEHLVKIKDAVLTEVFVVAAIHQALEQFYQVCLSVVDQQSPMYLLILVGFVGLTLSEFFLYSLIIPLRAHDVFYKKKRTPLFSFIFQHAKALVTEMLRVFVVVLMWSLLFILPGIYKQIRYFMVPYIVLFDPQYHSGQVDALKRSNELTKELVFPLFLIFIASYLITLYDEDLTLYSTTIDHLRFFSISLLINLSLSIYTYTLVYFLYQKRSHSLFGENQQQQIKE